MKKRVLAFIFTTALSLSMITSASAVSLYIDNQRLETDVPPQIINDRTMVPIGHIFTALGAQVTWDGETRTATGVKDDTTIVIKIDDPIAYVNGQPVTLDSPAVIVDSRTMVPAAFVSQALGCDVTWDGATQTAAVAYQTKGHKIYITRTGSKYHYDNTCNGGTYYESTLAEAMGRGLEPCAKCVK